MPRDAATSSFSKSPEPPITPSRMSQYDARMGIGAEPREELQE